MKQTFYLVVFVSSIGVLGYSASEDLLWLGFLSSLGAGWFGPAYGRHLAKWGSPGVREMYEQRVDELDRSLEEVDAMSREYEKMMKR